MLLFQSRRSGFFSVKAAAGVKLKLLTRRFVSEKMVLLPAVGVQDLYEAGEVEMIGLLYHPFTLSSFAGNLPDSSLMSFLRDEAFVLSAAASLSSKTQTKTLLSNHVNTRFPEDKEQDVSEAAKSLVSFIRELDECMASVALMALLHLRVFLEKTFSKYMTTEEKQKTWIGAYGDSDFQACASLVEEDLECRLLLQQNSDSKWNTNLQHVYKSTLTKQLRVFACAYPGRKEMVACGSNPWHPINLLFATDFDITCTIKDTSEILVSVAEKNSSSSNGTTSGLEDRYWALMKVHDNRIKEFLSLWEYGNVSAKLTPVSEPRSRFRQLIPGMDLGLEAFLRELDLQHESSESSCCEYESSNLRSILKSLGDLEKRINKEVMAAGLLRGVRREQVREEVKRIPLLHRCSEFLQQLSAMNTPIHYISASWSRDLILGGLPKLPDGLLFVHSNDLEYNSSGVSTGMFRGVVENAFDKEAILHALRRLYKVYPEEQKRAVFLGDSTNDLLALLDADLGIVMGQNPAFREMLLRYNLQLLPLAVAAAHIRASVESDEAKSFRHSGILFEASGWAEVEACLLTNY